MHSHLMYQTLNIHFSVVTDEPVEFEKLPGQVQNLQDEYESLYRDLCNIRKISEEKPKDRDHVTNWTWKH